MVTKESPDNEEIVIEKDSEVNLYKEMYIFAEACKYDAKSIFNWVLENGRSDEEKMSLYGEYVYTITKIQVTNAVKNEDKLKLLRVLD